MSDSPGVERQDVCSLPEGCASLTWPCPLSPESVRDLEDWLLLVVRKVRRSAVPTPEEPSTEATRRIPEGPADER